MTGIVALAVIAGCGGGGGGSSSSTGSTGGTTGGGTTGGASSAMSTTFHVDVASGQVTVTPPSTGGATTGALSGHAIFSGSTVTFNSSTLLDQAGSVGLRSLKVAVTNNWGLPIGQAADGTVTGFKVIFSPFTNVGAFSDIRSKSIVSTLAGSGVSGTTDGPSGAASFTGPSDTAVDSTGNVYVADYLGKQIRVIRSGLVSRLLTPAALGSPFGIALNPSDGALIVTEISGNVIRRILPDGRMSTIAGTGVVGSINGTGNVATFSAPSGVAVDSSGAIYVVDVNNNKVRKIVFLGGDPTAPTNYQVTTLAGSGGGGSADGPGATATFNKPSGIAIDANGSLFVADTSNNRIRRIDPAGNVTTVAGTGTATETDGSGEMATFNGPRGVVVINGALIVSDEIGNRIRQVTLKAGGTANPTTRTSWLVQTLAGTGGTGSTDGTGDVATFNAIKLIAADKSGNLYLPEISSHKIRRLTPAKGSSQSALRPARLPRSRFNSRILMG